MLSNGHFVAALLVAPVLAIIGWFAVDNWVSEEPEKARAGETYKLVGNPNCRYESGECTLRNGNFELTLQARPVADDTLRLEVKSRFPLQGASAVWLMEGQADGTPSRLEAAPDSNRQWQAILPGRAVSDGSLRLLVRAQDAFYYGETGTRFVNYQTSFGQDFRQ